jgi:polysaccharide deacetylase 2 family uncharacterized protein YibQ
MLAGPAFAANTATPRIAIIIDDLGYERVAGERAIALPGPVTYAVLPGTPTGWYLAQQAKAAGKEIILHLPLQAAARDESGDPGSLLLDMSRLQFAETFRSNLQAVPHVIGINSHRGSLLTRHPGHMDWLMEEILQQENLFFVDSYTTAQSVAMNIAAEKGVPAIKRDVFLDPDLMPGTVEREFSRLKDIARQQGFAIGIGHPREATLTYLEQALPRLRAEGYELVNVSALIGASKGRKTAPLPAAE